MEPSAKHNTDVPWRRMQMLHRRAQSTRPCCFDGVNVSRWLLSHTHEQYSQLVGRSVAFTSISQTYHVTFPTNRNCQVRTTQCFSLAKYNNRTTLVVNPVCCLIPFVRPSVGFRWRPERHANLFRVRVSRQRVLQPVSWIIWTPGGQIHPRSKGI